MPGSSSEAASPEPLRQGEGPGELRDDVCFVVDITELKDEDYMLDLGELRDDVCQVEKITELKDEPKRASRSHRRTARS